MSKPKCKRISKRDQNPKRDEIQWNPVEFCKIARKCLKKSCIKKEIPENFRSRNKPFHKITRESANNLRIFL